MKAGDLRHIIVFEHDTNAQLAPELQVRDSFGAPVETWAEAFRVPGLFTYKTGEEADDAGMSNTEIRKRRSEMMAKVRIRYKSGIDPDIHRIVFDGQRWNISPPIPDPKNTEQTLEAFLVI